jgi:DNA-binding transcriptional ArsR family regulator
MNAFMALADPTRLQIFELIAKGEKSAGDIVAHFRFKAPTISQHLRTLKEAKLVRVRAEGQRRYYAVDKTGLKEIETWLSQVSKEWNGYLDELELVLAEEQNKTEGQNKTKE